MPRPNQSYARCRVHVACRLNHFFIVTVVPTPTLDWISKWLMDDFDIQSNADLGLDIEIIHQPFRAGQPHAQSVGRRVTVLHGLSDIRDARSPVTRDDAQAAFGPLMYGPKDDFSTLCMHDNVARNFGDGGGNQGHFHAV